MVFKVSVRERNENWAESLLGSQWLALDQPARETSAPPGSMPTSSALAARARERRRNDTPRPLRQDSIGVILGCIRVMEKKMETTRTVLGYRFLHYLDRKVLGPLTMRPCKS